MLRYGGYEVDVLPLDNAKVPPPARTHYDLQVYHCIPDMLHRVKKTTTSLAVATFETTSPPQHWASLLAKHEAVIVPSLFNLKIFKELCPILKIGYVPHPLDFQIFRPCLPGEPLVGTPPPASRKFTFLWIGNWRERKGYKELIEAFSQEFSPNENVELILKTDKNKAEKYLKPFSQSKPGLNLSVDPGNLPEFELVNLIRRASCCVQVSYGEGFGLSGQEAMACGVPLIISAHTGCLDYASEQTAWLLHPKRFKVIPWLDRVPQFREKSWAEVDVPDLRRLMRTVFACEPDDRLAKVQAGLACVKYRFSYEAVLEKFTQVLNLL